MYTPRFGVCIRTPDTSTGWTLHSDHTAATDALSEAATLRNAGTPAHAFDWAGPDPKGTMLDPADLVQGDAKLRENSGDADATENHANGRGER